MRKNAVKRFLNGNLIFTKISFIPINFIRAIVIFYALLHYIAIRLLSSGIINTYFNSFHSNCINCFYMSYFTRLIVFIFPTLHPFLLTFFRYHSLHLFTVNTILYVFFRKLSWIFR